MINLPLAFLLLIAGALKNEPTPVVETDICIYGGTSAGVVAAIQAAKMGKTVALVEPSGHLGGMTTEGLGGTDVNNHGGFKNDAAVGGLALEFYHRTAHHYGITDFVAQKQHTMTWRFEPHVAERIFTDWIASYELIQIHTGHRLLEVPDAVRKSNTEITEFRTKSGTVFRAKVFIDATYEGDLLARAGVTTVIGREPNARYDETKNGIRSTNTYRQFEVVVDPYRQPGKLSSGLIATIQNEPLGTPGAGDERIQAYCYRMCLTQDSTNQRPFVRPAYYDRTQYEIYQRYLAAGGNLYQPRTNIPNGKTDLGAWHDLSHNLYGMNHAYPGGSYAVRDSIVRQHRTFTQGLFYYLAHDTAVARLAPELQVQWQTWGLAADEFTDNEGWPRQVYVRDARRMVSDYVITEHHTRRVNPTPVPDPVGVAYWPPDTHHVRRIVQQGQAYNEGFVFGGDDWGPFGISYRALIPRAAECTNLITPTCVSSSHVAYGAIRLEWTFMVLGQAAATAAALAINQETTVQAVPYGMLRKQLQQDEQVLSVDR